MPEHETRTYAFGEFLLDGQVYELRRGDTLVRIEPKVFDVLAYLVAHRERVVTKDELLAHLWPGEFVSESVLPRCITAARKALGEDSTTQKIIQTVHGRGYRFAAPARAVETDTPPLTSEDARAEPESTIGRGDRQAGIFVGREAAMQTLLGALDDALASRGRLMLLVGEPGIGKTRTAEQLASIARDRGMIVLEGRSYEAAGAPAFWPWVQILRDAADSAALPASLTSEISQLLCDMGGGATHEAGADTIPPEQARFRLFDAVASFLRSASRACGLVLVLDDLHWADKASLLLLLFITREIRDARVLLVGTYRDVELRREHPLASVLGELAREPSCSRVVLRGLSEPEVGRYIESTVADAPAEKLVAAVHEMTQGNPFFLGEIVRLLIAEGRLERGEARLGEFALPQGVREAIGRRLNELSADCNRLLTVAAVIGRDFGLNVLEHVAALPRDRILELLDEAASARIVLRAAGALATYEFSHALVRETLYEEIPTPKRVRLHRDVAEALEDLYRSDAVALDRIAHHHFQAAPGGDVAKAVDACVRAAEHATRLLAYEQAAEHCERALIALELESSADPDGRTELLLALGEAQSCSGERDKARDTFARAAAIARDTGRPDQLARAALGFGGRGEMGMPRDEPLRELLDEALAALGSEHPALRSMILGRLVGTAPYYESMDMRAKLSAEALELARRADDVGTLIKALAARGWAMLGPDFVAERFAIATELLAIAEQAGHTASAFLGREYRIGVLLVLGDIAAADREIAAAARMAEQMRQPVYRWFATWWQASRALCDGRLDDAELLRHEALEIGQKIGHPGAMAIFAGQGLWLAYERGGPQEMFQPGFEFLLSYYPRAEVALRSGEALFYCLVDRLEEARACFEALASQDFTDIPRDEHWLSSITGLAEVCAQLGDRSRAAMLYDLLRPFAERNCVHDLLRTYNGSVSHYLALLAACREDFDAAVAHFESALAMNEKLGAKPYVGRTQYEYARVLLRRGGAGDTPRARELLSRCATLAGGVGLHELERKARDLAESSERPKQNLNSP